MREITACLHCRHDLHLRSAYFAWISAAVKVGLSCPILLATGVDSDALHNSSATSSAMTAPPVRPDVRVAPPSLFLCLFCLFVSSYAGGGRFCCRSIAPSAFPRTKVLSVYLEWCVEEKLWFYGLVSCVSCVVISLRVCGRV